MVGARRIAEAWDCDYCGIDHPVRKIRGRPSVYCPRAGAVYSRGALRRE